jgi:hypothetical protein
MGVDNDVKVILGVEYSYDELENFRKHKGTINCANEIGTSNLTCIWCEFNYPYASPYFDADEKDCYYFLGYDLKHDITPEAMHDILEKIENVKVQIKTFSEKYNIPNKEDEVKFIFRPHVW